MYTEQFLVCNLRLIYNMHKIPRRSTINCIFVPSQYIETFQIIKLKRLKLNSTVKSPVLSVCLYTAVDNLLDFFVLQLLKGLRSHTLLK